MFYRESGDFKTSCIQDQQIFPILQDRVFVAVVVAIVWRHSVQEDE